MRLLVDEGVDKPIVDQLRTAGFDVHYILETNRRIEGQFSKLCITGIWREVNKRVYCYST